MQGRPSEGDGHKLHQGLSGGLSLLILVEDPVQLPPAGAAPILAPQPGLRGTHRSRTESVERLQRGR